MTFVTLEKTVAIVVTVIGCDFIREALSPFAPGCEFIRKVPSIVWHVPEFTKGVGIARNICLTSHAHAS